MKLVRLTDSARTSSNAIRDVKLRKHRSRTYRSCSTDGEIDLYGDHMSIKAVNFAQTVDP